MLTVHFRNGVAKASLVPTTKIVNGSAASTFWLTWLGNYEQFTSVKHGSGSILAAFTFCLNNLRSGYLAAIWSQTTNNFSPLPGPLCFLQYLPLVGSSSGSTPLFIGGTTTTTTTKTGVKRPSRLKYQQLPCRCLTRHHPLHVFTFCLRLSGAGRFCRESTNNFRWGSALHPGGGWKLESVGLNLSKRSPSSSRCDR